MSFNTHPVLILMALLLLTGAIDVARAGEQSFTLTEHLGQTWRDQPVSFALAPPQGACDARSLEVSGDAGPVPAQLSEVTYWPKTRSVKTARVWVITDLDPLTQRTFTARYTARTRRVIAPQTDLVVQQDGQQIELRTDRFGVRVLAGQQTYAAPMVPEQVPGPVRGLRLSDGSWVGGSRLFGKAKITGYTVTLDDAGPVIGQATVRYRYEDGNELAITIRLAARSGDTRWTAVSREQRPDDGWALDVSSNGPPMTYRLQRKRGEERRLFAGTGLRTGDWLDVPVTQFADGEVLNNLVPYAEYWNEVTSHLIRLHLGAADSKRELQVQRWDAGCWVAPQALGTLGSWDYWLAKAVPMVRENGQVVMKINNAAGMRRWRIGESAPLDETTFRGTWMAGGGGQVLTELPELEQVKEYILDWPGEDDAQHPRLYMSHDEYLQALAKNPALGKPSAGGLIDQLNTNGEFDKLRQTASLISQYDAVINTDAVPVAQRKLLRARMAYLAYLALDPSSWSIERGYRTYNFNMSAAFGLMPGMFATLFPTHPLAKSWAHDSNTRLQLWLTQMVGPAGEFPESLHYSQVTMAMLVTYAIAMKQAGLHDFFDSPNAPLLRFGMYLAKQYMPPDPLLQKVSVSPPVGRGEGGPFALTGLLARATADTLPDYSRLMQWAWSQTGYSTMVPDNRLGGQERLYLNRELPLTVPYWQADWFPRTGIVLRHGIGSAEPHYLNMITNTSANSDIWAPEFGNIDRWYAWGIPIGGSFREGYNNRHELLKTGIVPARSYQPGQSMAPFGHRGTAKEVMLTSLPRQAYVRLDSTIQGTDTRDWKPENLPAWPPVAKVAGTPPISWLRQAVWVKGADAAEPCYLVLRDTVSGGQPTMWQYWTLSDKLGATDETANRATFLADKPGDKVAPYRALTGDRFTAAGANGIDLDYYVASPTDTPRHTLRWGASGFVYQIGRIFEWQDLLHLQLPGDGHYFVALVPRRTGEQPPRFSTLGDGAIIRVDGTFGHDYVFAHDTRTAVQADAVAFDGTAGSVQDRPSGLALALGAAGTVRSGDYAIAADSSAGIAIHGQQARVTAQATENKTERAITLTLPGTWELAAPTAGVTLTRQPTGSWRLILPPGVTMVELMQRTTDAGK